MGLHAEPLAGVIGRHVRRECNGVGPRTEVSERRSMLDVTIECDLPAAMRDGTVLSGCVQTNRRRPLAGAADSPAIRQEHP